MRFRTRLRLLATVFTRFRTRVAIRRATGTRGRSLMVAAAFIENTQIPDVIPVLGAALLLLIAAVAASLLPAARAARVDVMDALRAD